MEIRPLVLRQELMDAYKDVDRQITLVKDEAESMEIQPGELRDGQGNWVMIPLLVAKAQLLHGLIILNRKGN